MTDLHSPFTGEELLHQTAFLALEGLQALPLDHNNLFSIIKDPRDTVLIFQRRRGNLKFKEVALVQYSVTTSTSR